MQADETGHHIVHQLSLKMGNGVIAYLGDEQTAKRHLGQKRQSSERWGNSVEDVRFTPSPVLH